MLRFIFPHWFSLSRARVDGAVRKPVQSVKICKFADIAILTAIRVTDQWKERQRYHE
jgi:hypothetical protein